LFSIILLGDNKLYLVYNKLAMKKLYTLILFLLLSFVGNSQIVNIPDANLKVALLNITASDQLASTQTPVYNEILDLWEVTMFNSIDANGDGEIQVSEAQAIKFLNIVISSVTNLTGLEAFSNLKYLKYRADNSITSVNFSVLTNLKSLDCSQSGITNLSVSNLTNLVYLDCSGNTIQNLDISTLLNLERLYSSGVNLNSLNTSQNLNLKYLECEFNLINSLNVGTLTNLETLKCSGNQLTSLNISGAINLKKLECNNNQLSNLDLSQNLLLEQLKCNDNLLSNLNLVGLNNLDNLSCNHNQLSAINVLGLNNLKNVDCSFNNIANLDFSTNINLINFYCQENQLTFLNITGLTNLLGFDCSNNSLSNLDISQNPNILGINCSFNQLSNLNTSQNIQFQNLYITFNNITALDLTQNVNLERLRCGVNLLTTLNLSQNPKLFELEVNSNLLQILFLKNGGFDSENPSFFLNIANNPNLLYICADEERIIQIQDKVDQFGYSANCTVNSYCTFTPGGTFYTIQGNSKLDSNNNGCDTNDSNYPNLKFSISDGTSAGTIISNATGNYAIPVSAGTHTFAPQLENPNYFTVSPTSTTVSFPATASPFTQNFCITPNGIFNDLEVTIIPVNVAVPGFDANYKILYKNKGNQIENASLSFSYSDSVLDYVSSLTTPTSQNSGNLNWNIGTLQPFQMGEILVTLNLNSPMETPALNSGDLLNFTATISGLNTDVSPLDNIFALNQIVVNSFDPNDKRCLEGNTINPTMIGNYIHYMIRFENTGTFNAQNVVVKDDIDLSKFDLSSLRMIQSSHPCITRINNTNKVEFIFENINLPFEDANNDGYVVFKIKTLPSLTVGSQVTNNASIYFDYNFPIITNTETSTFQLLKNESFTSNSNFTIYPNPAKNKLHITSKNLENISSITVYNALGQIILTSINPSETIDVSNLKTGNYLIKINSENKTSNLKFIKE
jgi:uncharacterized repeat protein (TIGR01451 family)